MVSRAYGYYKIELFSGRLVVPCKFMLATENSDEDKRIPLKQTFNGRPVRTIKVLAVDDKGSEENKEKIIEVADVERVIQFSEIEKAVLQNGRYVKICEFKGLAELMEEHNEKKSDRSVEVVGCHPMSLMISQRFNGRQFVLCAGESSKPPTEANIKVFKCLQDYLKNSNKYLHIRFYTRCATAQEIGALFCDVDGNLRISGLLPDIDLKEINFPKYEATVDEAMTKMFAEKMSKVYNDQQEKPTYDLPWFSRIRKALELTGAIEKYVEKKVLISEKVNASLLDTLMDI